MNTATSPGVVEVLHPPRLGPHRPELLPRPEGLVLTLPSSSLRSLVRTNAPPLPGFTCWNSRIR